MLASYSKEEACTDPRPRSLDRESGIGSRRAATVIRAVPRRDPDQALFWVYTIYYIISHADPKGDGMEIVAIGPMSFIFFALVLPALMIGLQQARVTASSGRFSCLLGFAANAIGVDTDPRANSRNRGALDRGTA